MEDARCGKEVQFQFSRLKDKSFNFWSKTIVLQLRDRFDDSDLEYKYIENVFELITL